MFTTGDRFAFELPERIKPTEKGCRPTAECHLVAVGAEADRAGVCVFVETTTTAAAQT